ncbi:MAG: LysR family transcriptional regulator [Burkholderia sp.]|jgi:DNA-binding transcriptional LysR family regulator|uniref:LysR family transcriptional regulator n=1 Tax=Burkholderia TaxID=32008 RepID=UPI000D0A4A25|nr:MULTISPECIES: LysR family transcriptional regulator [Burkholderia]MBY8605410.1 LysR family transcriptional regulator [Burkholderia arboris]MCA3777637.1 LysR family transcriptional regulator [Burkholderia sp.]MCA3783508.1 LysR family transcriptional regulator [Burkholderia sp.]MCA3792580.1 LysR family transcriptional regulator [Burkholderia sp.]MCA3806254.1 LysR family transcriptional regulator [Burkholderia sp.]
MDTRDLEYLLAVERHGSIGKAAEALGLSQPALTKAVQRLEAQVGVTLFERTANGMTATPAGARFVARAQRIALEFDDAMQEMRAIRGGEQGIVRIGYSPTVPNAFVLGACRQLIRERPAARLRLRCRLARELLDLLAAGELDLVVAPEPQQPDPALDTIALFDDRLTVLADAAHPLQRKRALTLADLADQEWLLPEATIPVRHRIDDAFRARGLPAPRLRVETDFGNTSLLQLLHGTSLLCVGGADALDQVTGLRALDLKAGELELDRRIGAMHRAGAYVPPLAQRMIALLQDGAA